MKISKGIVAGLGVAGLLVALPVAGQSAAGGTSGSSGSSGSMGTGSSGTSGSSGSSGSMGTGSGSSSSGSMGGSTYGSSGNQVTGKVDKVDRSSNQLTLQLRVSDSTQVMKDGHTASLSDIKEGDHVRASLSSSGQVQRIDVMSSGSHGMGGSSGSMGGSSGSHGMGGSSGSSGTTPGGSTGTTPGGSTGTTPGGGSGTSQ